MSDPLVECIPNFSEARRPEVIQSITKSIQSVQDVSILDKHSDLDHNRTVITLVGSPHAVEEAAFQAIARAAQLIDLNLHRGEHPRIGATDVVPFVPLRDISMAECIEIARRLGKRVGSELNIPVYLYEAAATSPERQNLEDLRRGEYEGLKEEISSKPERTPDFGPHFLGPAGATVIGARQPLIAFNVYLTTSDVSIAQKIAKAIRFSSGGLRYVKSLGLLVEGMAQVSMNLTNYRQTPIALVVELIRREAARYGVAIHHSELVGLSPQEALLDAAVWYLQLDAFTSEQVLEQRLYSIQPGSKAQKEKPTSPTFLDQLASGSPTPGGGSASAYSGAMATALVAMVGRLTIGKPKYATVEKQMWEIIEKAENLRADLTLDVQRDAEAFGTLMKATKKPKNTPEQQSERAEAIEKATLQAAQVPLEVANKAISILELALQAATYGNLNAISDAGSAAAMARAAFTGAALNVRVNTKNLKNTPGVQSMLEEINKLDRKASEIETNFRKILIDRSGIILD